MSGRQCSYRGCEREVRAKDLCFAHYLQRTRGQELRPLRPGKVRARCAGPDCTREAAAQGLCGGHYQQALKGSPLSPLRRKLRSTDRDDEGRKQCGRCHQWKPEDQFYPTGKGNSDGLAAECIRCDRDMRLIRQYGISVDRYEEMLTAQGGGCAICQRPEGTTSLHIDHDHSCCPERKKSCGNCIRGLLCEDCNRAIGMLQDSPRLLVNAIGYLNG